MKKIGKLSTEEQALLDSVESGEWQSVKTLEKEKELAGQLASNTLKKDARSNIRVSPVDLDRLKSIAANEGLPYQTLIASILHKYAAGHFKKSV